MCKDYLANQFIAQDNDKAENIDSHMRRILQVLQGSFVERDYVPRYEVLERLNKFITSRFVRSLI